jgi:MFS-type transporter involved in bile tolerance (Atg22 family)
MKNLQYLVLFVLVVYLVWVNPFLITIAGQAFVIFAALLCGMFLGSYYAKSRQNMRWTIKEHARYLLKLLLERLK